MTNFKSTSAFETERLVLRDFEAADAPAIVAALNDAEMCYGLTVVPLPYTRSDAEWFIAEGSSAALAVCLRDGTLIGAIGLGKTFGYWIAKAHWGNGYATEAAKPVLNAHFAQSDAHVVSSYVDDNQASGKVLAKLGFTIDGPTHLHIRSRGKEVPAVAVSLTKEQWTQIT